MNNLTGIRYGEPEEEFNKAVRGKKNSKTTEDIVSNIIGGNKNGKEKKC